MKVNMRLSDLELAEVLSRRILPQALPKFKARPNVYFYVPTEDIASRMHDELDTILVTGAMLYNHTYDYVFKELEHGYTFTIFVNEQHAPHRYAFVFDMDEKLNIIILTYHRYDHRNGKMIRVSFGNMKRTLEAWGQNETPGIFIPLNEYKVKVLGLKKLRKRDMSYRNIKIMNKEFKVPKEEYEEIKEVLDQYIAALELIGAVDKTHSNFYVHENFCDDTEQFTLTLTTKKLVQFKHCFPNYQYEYAYTNWRGEVAGHNQCQIYRGLRLTLDLNRKLLESRVEFYEYDYDAPEYPQELKTMKLKEQLRWLINYAI